MNVRNGCLIVGVLIAVALLWLQFSVENSAQDAIAKSKVSIRQIGHQILLKNQDTSSVVSPVKALDENTYRLSFEKGTLLALNPSDIVAIIQSNIEKTELPTHYRVEVLQCTDEEVAYSYEMKFDQEKAIIPCKGRVLPAACYALQIRFLRATSSYVGLKIGLYLLLFTILIVFYKDHTTRNAKNEFADVGALPTVIGSFQFYESQNKIVRGALEVALSRKECELLAIFAANQNQIVSREELTKKVWEDQGVVVGRSLDTYISKLRKKLKEDTALKLTNVHGVGYKLEVGL